MRVYQQRGGWVIIATFLAAFVLTAVPVPEWAASWRPAWVALVLVYWCMELPERVGIGVGWTLGLLLDALTGTLLGQHALAMSVSAYLAVKTRRQIRVFPLVQQVLVISFILASYLLMMLFVKAMSGIPPQDWVYAAPALSSALVWPWLFALLKKVRRRAHVS
ncbi:MAG: rod shape-determining protein MreD [Gammaproteobacteria bacterium]